MTTPPKSIEDLVGEELSAVSFVRDYVEFHFDGPVVRALSDPIAFTSAGFVQFPEAGSRDALCQSIGRVVIHIDLKDDSEFRITFDHETWIVVPLGSDAPGGESMHFVPTLNATLDVWA